jgi:hypothetical protein
MARDGDKYIHGDQRSPACHKERAMQYPTPNCFQLCFRSLFQSGREYAFPCDGQGRVDMDGLTERARLNYLFARAMVGRELSVPAVETVAAS